MCHENEEWNNIWKRIVVSVQNWYEEFDEFWPKHSKSSKICLLMGWFWPKYIMLELKSTEEFERHFYMKIIVTIIPANLATNSLLSLSCSSIEAKSKNQIFSKLED